MKDELVKAGDFNVVIVDWAGGSLPLYTQATANTRLVGLEIAHFINTLEVNTLLITLFVSDKQKIRPFLNDTHRA